MKKLVFLLLVICQTAYGQSSKGTTLEEFNYLRKGYQIQVESGLDMKKGYTLVDLMKSEVSNRFNSSSMVFKGLYRDGQQTPCAILCIMGRYYVCIPHYESSDEIWKEYFDSVKNLPDIDRIGLLKGLARTTAFFAQNN